MFKSTSQFKFFRQPSSWTSTRSTSPSAVEEHAGAVSKSALMASGFPQIFSHKILPPPHVFFFFSKNFLSRCIPDVVTENANVAGQLFSNSGAQDFFEELMGDLQNCGPQIVQMGVVALVFSLIITLLFRFLAGFIVGLPSSSSCL